MRIYRLAPWETATDVTPAVQQGLLPYAAASSLTALCAVILLVVLWPVMGWAGLPTALVFGRLMALDLTTYTLPNIYTVPLISIGLIAAFNAGQLTQALIAILILMLFSRTLTRANLRGRSLGFGGGDLKLLAAMFAFLPLVSAFWAIAVGSLLWMPVAFVKPKAMVPFGVPLILGWTIFLRWPDLPKWVFSTIS